ncbi:MAG TPA: DNA topoisomerase IB [Polyangiaceae bacterium]
MANVARSPAVHNGLPTNPVGEDAAASAGLRYVLDDVPGILRLGRPPRFRYVHADHRAVRDEATLARIRRLAIPPAWTGVWICTLEHGHIQATGRDARGRKQYRYHPHWRSLCDAHKYDRMLAFGRALPKIRAAVARDLALRGLPREKVLATVVRLLELTHARVGNEQYARANKSYGLTTLHRRHVDVHGDVVTFHFRGKSGKTHVFDVHAPRVARVVRQCGELPGQHLFEYLGEDGAVHTVGSHDVNAYIQAASGGEFSAKDFRTLAGTVLAARALRDGGPCSSKAQMKRRVREALGVVASLLGNTVAVCRKAYVHPIILDAYERSLLGAGPADLKEEEQSVLRLVARWGGRANRLGP